MCEQERLAMFYFWCEVGRRMGITELPGSYAAFAAYNIDYEKRYYRFTEANRRVGAATVEMFASWFPRFVRPLVRRAIYALLDESVIEGFGFPRPSPAPAAARDRRLTVARPVSSVAARSPAATAPHRDETPQLSARLPDRRTRPARPAASVGRLATGARRPRATAPDSFCSDYFAASCRSGCCAALSTAAASLATEVPSKKRGFCVPHSFTALVKTKSRKLSSVMCPSSTSS
jgi:hypothetical protein